MVLAIVGLVSRIIAGTCRGQRLSMPPGDRTRPTSDRVREAVFSSLAAWAGSVGGPPELTLAGLSFLDLFAGSGAVGLEAASRGAGPVLLVEADRRTAELASRNARQLSLSASTKTERVERLLLNEANRAWDVVWLDAPYGVNTAELEGLLAALIAQGWLAEGGLVIMERATRSEAPNCPALAETWSRRYGETTIYYAMRGSADDDGDPESDQRNEHHDDHMRSEP